jgi:hypothetical protein
MSFASNVAPRRRIALIEKRDWRCPECGSQNKAHWASCSSCGRGKRPA